MSFKRMSLTRPLASRCLRLGIVLVALGVLNGCSAFVPWRVPVEVHASDPGARLYVNDEFVGTGSATVHVRRNQANVFEARLEERTRRQTVRDELSVWGILDALGGMAWYGPYIGLIMPGAWEPMERFVQLDLPPAPFRVSPHLVPPADLANSSGSESSGSGEKQLDPADFPALYPPE